MLRRIISVTLVAASAAPLAHATNLWQVWQMAQANDPAFRQAVANRNASMQAKPEAWANLFPSVDLTASRTWDNTSGSRNSFFGSQVVPVQNSANDRQNEWGAQLTQTLFNWQQFKALGGADSTVAEAQATYESTLQSLMVSVSQAYFNVLNASDNLSADIANERALKKQYQQTEEQYKVGLAAITGVKQAEAGYDTAKAQVIADRQALAQAREALRAITGQYVGDLEEPRSELPLNPPQPANVQTWVQKGLQQNPSLLAAQYSSKVAENQVAQQKGGYLPQLNLVLQHTYQSVNGNSSYAVPGNPPPTNSPDNSRLSDNQIGLQLSWNIFSGGATRAAVRQYQYQADAAMAQEISQRRTVEQQVRNAYLAVLSGIAQVQATQQSVAASRVSLEATQAGLKVGTQTVLDVLISQRDLLTTEKAYYSARYNYLVAVLQLEQAAGSLTPDDLQRLNGWLSPAAASAPASAPAAMSAPVPATGSGSD